MLKLKLNTLATWCEELTHWKRPWCWEGLGAGGEGADRGWDGWMASSTQWTWVWMDSRSWWWTGRPGVLQFMGLQRAGHDWATELTDAKKFPKKKNIKKKKKKFPQHSDRLLVLEQVFPKGHGKERNTSQLSYMNHVWYIFLIFPVLLRHTWKVKNI